MNDERFLKDWLRDTSDSNANPNAAADKVVARIPDTPQRRRWLPWPPAPRSKPDEPNGRTRFMFSPIQAVTAGALVFAIGGVMFIAGPLSDTSSPVPGAEATTIEPVPFTADYEWSYSPSSGVTETENGVIYRAGTQFLFTPVEASDERFLGNSVNTVNSQVYPDGTEIQYATSRIETDEGAWQEQPQFTLTSWEDSFDGVHRAYVGEGEYDGLVAVAVASWQPDGPAGVTLRLEGFVLADELPVAPEDPS